MDLVLLSKSEGIAEVLLRRGKVNALNEQMVEEITAKFQTLAAEEDIKAVILTAEGPFFSFGFDIPEFLGYSKESFSGFLKKFTALYTYLFTYPKPVVAGLNGHAIAGGCMLALACDHRIMVSGKAKISLNEITFGSSVFAGSAAMLKFLIGGKRAQEVLFRGSMFSADEAMNVGLVDQVTHGKVMQDARKVAAELAAQNGAAFHSIKTLLRGPAVEEIAIREEQSIREFVDIWYSKETWSKLQRIEIRS
jgi:Delta3-Delta2-enoyl-CoA isomerase